MLTQLDNPHAGVYHRWRYRHLQALHPTPRSLPPNVPNMAPKPIIKRVLDEAGDVGEFLAGPRPDDIIGGAYHDHGRWVCDSYANIPEWAKTGAAIAGQGGVNLGMKYVCGPYLGDGYPIPAPPFTGGQCPTAYLVDYVNSGPGLPTAQSFLTGPCGAVRSLPPNEFGLISWEQQDGNGIWVRFRGTGDPNEKWTVANVTRVDGQPDNCGNPPNEPTRSPTAPPDPGPNPPGGGQPPTFDPTGTPIFRPGPIDNPYGDPIEFPPIDPFNPSGGDDGDPFDPTDPYPPLEPGEQGEGGDPQDTGDGGEAEGEADTNKVLVGLKINILEVADRYRQYANGVYRGLCYVYMGGTTGLDQDYAGSMISDGQFIFAEKENLTRWRVNANSGVSLRVTPYYRGIEA